MGFANMLTFAFMHHSYWFAYFLACHPYIFYIFNGIKLWPTDVPSVDGVAGESVKVGMMGEPDEDGVWEVRGVLGGDDVKRPFGVKEIN